MFAGNSSIAAGVAERSGNLQQCARISRKQNLYSLNYTNSGWNSVPAAYYASGRIAFVGQDGDLLDDEHGEWPGL